MKKGFLLFIAVLLCVSFSEPCRHKKGGSSYELVVKYNGSYCAGAKPQEEILKEIGKERELSNTTIKIYPAGKKKPVYKVKTNGHGKATVILPEGEWKYTLTSEIGKDVLYLNKKCSKAITKVYGTFTTKASGAAQIEILYHFECDPCDPNAKRRQ